MAAPYPSRKLAEFDNAELWSAAYAMDLGFVAEHHAFMSEAVEPKHRGRASKASCVAVLRGARAS